MPLMLISPYKPVFVPLCGCVGGRMGEYVILRGRGDDTGVGV